MNVGRINEGYMCKLKIVELAIGAVDINEKVVQLNVDAM